MALATKPRMLLLDEPMAGLGPEESARMVQTLRELKRELTILLIEHDMEAVFALADRITVLVYGRVIASGAPAAIRANAEVRQAYLGEQEAVTHVAEPLLDVDNIETCYGLSQVLFGISLAIARGRDGDADGPQRHGQDHDRALDHGADAGDAPARSASAARRSAACRPTAWRKLGIGLVPEGRQIFPNLTTRENLVATAANRGEAADPWTLDKVCELFPRLAERLGSMGNLLSGGEQQMLAIGRALMTNPRLLILDEATEGLAPLIRAEIWQCLTRLKAAGPVDPGDRQERRGADPHRRPPLPDRARQGGVEGHLGGTRRRAGRAAPVSRDLSSRVPGAARHEMTRCRPGTSASRPGDAGPHSFLMSMDQSCCLLFFRLRSAAQATRSARSERQPSARPEWQKQCRGTFVSLPTSDPTPKVLVQNRPAVNRAVSIGGVLGGQLEFKILTLKISSIISSGGVFGPTQIRWPISLPSRVGR